MVWYPSRCSHWPCQTRDNEWVDEWGGCFILCLYVFVLFFYITNCRTFQQVNQQEYIHMRMPCDEASCLHFHKETCREGGFLLVSKQCKELAPEASVDEAALTLTAEVWTGSPRLPCDSSAMPTSVWIRTGVGGWRLTAFTSTCLPAIVKRKVFQFVNYRHRLTSSPRHWDEQPTRRPVIMRLVGGQCCESRFGWLALRNWVNSHLIGLLTVSGSERSIRLSHTFKTTRLREQ